MKILAFIYTYNEADILPWVLRHLREQGVHTHVLDNWSTDFSFDIAKKLADTATRFPEEPSDAFQLHRMLTHLQDLSRISGADWCINHDADEIRRSPWPDLTLHDAITRVDAEGFNAINHRVLLFRPIDNGWDGSCSPEEYFQYYESDSHYDKQYHVKAWKNSQPVYLANSGGHMSYFENMATYPRRFLIKHYSIRSQDHGMRKVLRERAPRFLAKEKFDMGWHCQYNGVTPQTNFLAAPGELVKWDEGFYRSL